ncbi:MAG: hypothetical protein ACRDZY_07890, partial [Acidimicrobiales bacterium]
MIFPADPRPRQSGAGPRQRRRHGLPDLTVVGEAIDNIKANRSEDIDLDRLGLADLSTFELLRARRQRGRFQLDGGAMRDPAAPSAPDRIRGHRGR